MAKKLQILTGTRYILFSPLVFYVAEYLFRFIHEKLLHGSRLLTLETPGCFIFLFVYCLSGLVGLGSNISGSKLVRPIMHRIEGARNHILLCLALGAMGLILWLVNAKAGLMKRQLLNWAMCLVTTLLGGILYRGRKKRDEAIHVYLAGHTDTLGPEEDE